MSSRSEALTTRDVVARRLQRSGTDWRSWLLEGALLVSLLPTIMLSGFIFPISSMPYALQLVTHIVPARYFLIALRGIVLKGSELSHLLPQFGALALYAIAMLGLASVRLAREHA